MKGLAYFSAASHAQLAMLQPEVLTDILLWTVSGPPGVATSS